MQTALENALMSFYKADMITYMEIHPEAFDEAVKLALSDKQPYAWRAGFLLGSCIKKNDSRLKKYIKEIIDTLPNKGDGHQRELLKILLFMEIEKKYEGHLFDVCVNLWEGINKQPSIRITALKMILRIVEKHPELSNEITFLTQDHYLDSLSNGVRHSISKLMKEVTLK